MNHASLFSGIGGFDLAADCAGWTNVFNCEIEPSCKTTLKYYWPDAEQYDDIRQTDFTPWRGKIDVLTGGFPCQPFSQAGKRLGTEDERHLWPEMLRAIREIRPRWIVGENVRGIITWSDGLVFEQVCTDLEAEGYEVQPFLLPACGVDAPHQRYRTWFVAHRSDARSEDVREPENGILPANLTSNAYNNGSYASENGQSVEARDGGHSPRTNKTEQSTRYSISRPAFAANTYGGRLWGEIYGNRKTELANKNGTPSYWENFPTQSPVCSGDDEFPGMVDIVALLEGRKARRPYNPFARWRKESIKGFGNAVVPLLVWQLLDTINQMEEMYR